MEERFIAKINKTETCWLWTASKDAKGYARFSTGGRKGKSHSAHRTAYELWVGQIPDNLVVRHKCKNKDCVNPEHLETGTQVDNEADKVRDGTTNRGERCGTAKLTNEQVADIRRRVGQKGVELAKEFGVSKATISQILSATTWTNA